jgi:hypothetical protein
MGHLCTLLVGIKDGMAIMKNMEVPQKNEKKKRIIIWSSDPITRCIFKGIKRYLHPMFTEVVFTIGKRWKQSECPLTDIWMKKIWYIHTM